MLSLFRKNAEQEKTSEPVDPEVTEHAAFAQWLDHQPDDRKNKYLNLAMSYGFCVPDVPINSEGEEPHD